MKKLISILLACMLLFAAAYAEATSQLIKPSRWKQAAFRFMILTKTACTPMFPATRWAMCAMLLKARRGWCCWKAPRLPLATTPGKPI